jgi:hypothetical protein
MSPLVENPERLIGQRLTRDNLSKRTYNVLARSGLTQEDTEGNEYIDAYRVAMYKNKFVFINAIDARSRGAERMQTLGDKSYNELMDTLESLGKLNKER